MLCLQMVTRTSVIAGLTFLIFGVTAVFITVKAVLNRPDTRSLFALMFTVRINTGEYEKPMGQTFSLLL